MIPLHDDNPTLEKPIVTISFIFINVLIFFLELFAFTRGEQASVIAWAFIPSDLFRGNSLAEGITIVTTSITLFTSMFLHSGWLHLIGNMLYLWIFGNNVEDVMGHFRFIVFYFICGLAATLTHAIANESSNIPTLGASGAISGVLGAYVLLYPHARILVFVPLGAVSRTMYFPAMWVLGFWFALQLISSWIWGSGSGGIAWGAHIGGFIAGMILIPIFRHRHVKLFKPGIAPGDNKRYRFRE